MTLRYFAFGLLLASATVTSADSDTHSTGDFAIDLGAVYGAIDSIRMYRDICTEDFPDLADKTRTAYDAWRTRYLPFVQEVDRTFTTAMYIEARRDPETCTKLLSKFATGLAKYKTALRDGFMEQGAASFRATCARFPEYVRTERGDIEHYYSEQVATMRRGPAK